MRRHFLSIVVLLCALLGAPAAVAACEGLRAADGLVLKPFLLSGAMGIRVASADCGEDRATFAFARADGRPVATATVTAVRAGDHADIAFTFSDRIAKAGYGVQATVQAHAAELFDVAATRLGEDGRKTAATRYPYDWKAPQQRNAREDGSVVPGLRAGGLNVVYDTPRLGEIQVERLPGRIRATFPFYDERNQAGDIGSVRRTVAPGDVAEMRIYAHADLARIQDARFGAPDRDGMAGVTVTQFPPRLWAPSIGSMTRSALAADPEGPHCGGADRGQGRDCFPTDAELTAFAEAAPGPRDIVIARLALPLPRVAAAIEAGGARPFFYLYFGALATRDGDRSIDPGWILSDSAGKPHVAPRSTQSEGRWLLLDLTKPAARRFFVDRALAAIDAGFAGVYIDGGNFWNMPNGLVGGVDEAARMSQNHGRHLLMQELRAAVRARDPDARIGMLANRFAEYMHAADFVQREGAALHWRDKDARAHERVVAFDPTAESARNWQARYGRLIRQPVFFACRGPNAVLVRSCREALPAPFAGIYYNAGGFDIYDGDLAAAVAASALEAGDLYVTRTESDAELLGDGVSRLRRETAGRVWFSRPAPLLDVAAGRPAADISHVYAFRAGQAYIPADRDGPDGWRWARQGFLYRDRATFVAGDFYVVGTPEAPASGSLRVRIAAEPHVDMARRTPMSLDAAPPDRGVTLRIVLPAGARYALTEADGRPARITSTRVAGEGVLIEAQAIAPLALTLSGLAQ